MAHDPKRTVHVHLRPSLVNDDQVLLGIAQYARGRLGWRVMVNAFSELPRHLWGRCDGVVLRGLGDDNREIAAIVREQRLPTVLIGSGETLGHEASVWTDDRRIGRLAAEHFLERGFRRFAYRGQKGFSSSVERLAGFQETVIRAGHEPPIDMDSGIPPEAWSLEDEYLELHDMLRKVGGFTNEPLAILAYSSHFGRRLIDACRQIEIHVPAQVAVIAGEDYPVVANLCVPLLSGIRLNERAMGFHAAEQLDRLLAGEQPRPVRVDPQRVVLRDSTDIVAAHDPALVKALALIRDEAANGLTVSDLAQRCGVSRRTLEYRFRDLSGAGPAEFIRRSKLQAARQMLLTTNLGTEAVAQACGFKTVNRFITLFRRFAGAPPATYRAQQGLVVDASPPAPPPAP